MSIFRDPKRPNGENDGFADIPYKGLADSVCAAEQIRVPFLGSGASLATYPPSSKIAPVDKDLVSRLCEAAGVTSECARIFLEIAAKLVLEIEKDANNGLIRSDPSESIKHGSHPPSAGKLAAAIEAQSSYDSFVGERRTIQQFTGRDDWDKEKLTAVLRSVAAHSGMGCATPPLLSVASYAEYVLQRDGLWQYLSGLFQGFSTVTCTHDLVARAAKHYIDKNKDNPLSAHYLIVTTNYDSLMEKALDAAALPYFVIAVPRKNALIHIKFSGNVQQYFGWDDVRYKRFLDTAQQPVVPSQFHGFRHSRPLVCLYKIHGCLASSSLYKNDSVVVSDEDYVWFLNQAAKGGVIPASVVELINGKTLMMLGYSFSDWNIRSFYKTVLEQRGLLSGESSRDYAVMFEVNPYDSKFIENKPIHLLETSLDRFCEEMRERIP